MDRIRGDKRIPIFQKYQPVVSPPQSEVEPAPKPERLSEIVVKEYRGKRTYEREVRKMIQQGWKILSVTERPAGGLETLARAILLHNAKSYYTVTYQRE